MATITKRTDNTGRAYDQVKVRLKGYPPQTETFDRLTDAKKWATQTEAAIRERRVVPLVGHVADLLRDHAKVRRLDADLLFPSSKRQEDGSI